MLGKDEVQRRFQRLLQTNPRTIRVIRSPGDVRTLNPDKVIEGGQRTFPNHDEQMLIYIADALANGKEVAIQAAGRDKVMVFAARDLFEKRGF